MCEYNIYIDEGCYGKYWNGTHNNSNRKNDETFAENQYLIVLQYLSVW